jgi:hypothetical protein
VLHVDNYDADHFINEYIIPTPPTLPAAIPGRIVNQSFVFLAPGYETNPPQRVVEQIVIDSAYDNYADKFQTLFVSAAGRGTSNEGAYAPGTCYNGIGVGVSDNGSPDTGPTLDNGRSKPDIYAPGGSTSGATPLVAGSATLLMQAGLRGDGGGDTNAASDMRTVKALLLNGAIKPNGWTNGPGTPLDARHGAGWVNVFNSYQQLIGGKHSAIEGLAVETNGLHLPMSGLGSSNPLRGWDFRTLSSSMSNDGINYYYFDATNDVQNTKFTFTATLVWNRHDGQSNINDLNLYLYNTVNSILVAESISFVNNVEHLYVCNLPQGRYNLQVWKAGGNAGNGRVTSDETYALAWEFFALPLAVSQSGTNVVLNWPIYPTGFVVESTPSLSAPSWTTIVASPLVIDGTNSLTLPASANQKFFRLRRPAF